jgi:hypothetical protein
MFSRLEDHKKLGQLLNKEFGVEEVKNAGLVKRHSKFLDLDSPEAIKFYIECLIWSDCETSLLNFERLLLATLALENLANYNLLFGFENGEFDCLTEAENYAESIGIELFENLFLGFSSIFIRWADFVELSLNNSNYSSVLLFVYDSLVSESDRLILEISEGKLTQNSKFILDEKLSTLIEYVFICNQNEDTQYTFGFNQKSGIDQPITIIDTFDQDYNYLLLVKNVQYNSYYFSLIAEAFVEADDLEIIEAD